MDRIGILHQDVGRDQLPHLLQTTGIRRHEQVCTNRSVLSVRFGSSHQYTQNSKDPAKAFQLQTPLHKSLTRSRPELPLVHQQGLQFWTSTQIWQAKILLQDM
jgi:hypothetical protein